jgi:DNA-binding GntR family transcriptional regulator
VREMLELFEIRIALERHAARDSATRVQSEFEIRPIWTKNRRAPGADYIAENKSFHKAVI